MSEHARIVELAVGAAGVADKNWEKRVHALIPRVASMFREPRDDEDATCPTVNARKVVEAHSFRAEYRGKEADDNTKRIFVKIYDPDHQGDNVDDDGCQTVRTEPMWSAAGRAVRETLEQMQPGQPAVFYRYSEPIEGGKKKMGVLVYVEPRRMPHQSTPPAHSDRGHLSPGPSSAPERQAPSEGSAPSGGAENPALKARFDKLSNSQRVAFMHACRESGIPNGLIPGDALDAALVIMSKIEPPTEGS